MSCHSSNAINKPSGEAVRSYDRIPGALKGKDWRSNYDTRTVTDRSVEWKVTDGCHLKSTIAETGLSAIRTGGHEIICSKH